MYKSFETCKRYKCILICWPVIRKIKRWVTILDENEWSSLRPFQGNDSGIQLSFSSVVLIKYSIPSRVRSAFCHPWNLNPDRVSSEWRARRTPGKTDIEENSPRICGDMKLKFRAKVCPGAKIRNIRYHFGDKRFQSAWWLKILLIYLYIIYTVT